MLPWLSVKSRIHFSHLASKCGPLDLCLCLSVKGDNCYSCYRLYLAHLKRRVQNQKKKKIIQLNEFFLFCVILMWPWHSKPFIPHYFGSICLKEIRKKKEKADKTNEVKCLKSFLPWLVLLCRLSSR